jgi:hypothetical protein
MPREFGSLTKSAWKDPRDQVFLQLSVNAQMFFKCKLALLKRKRNIKFILASLKTGTNSEDWSEFRKPHQTGGGHQWWGGRLYFSFQPKWSKLESNTHRCIICPIKEKIGLKVTKEKTEFFKTI